MRFVAGMAALVAATLIGLRASFACEEPGPLTNKFTVRLRDGAAHALFINEHLSLPQYGIKGYTEERRMVNGDIDYRCDGYCTFGDPKFPEGVIRVPVGERQGVHGCYDNVYVCKRGRASRCRKLARLGSTTTTTVFDRSICPTTTLIVTDRLCFPQLSASCPDGTECLPTGPNGKYECSPPTCGAGNFHCGGGCPSGQKCTERSRPAGCDPIGCECK